MAIKIKKSLYEELIKIKRQKKGVSSYLIRKGYSKAWAESISKNWTTLEVVGGPASVSTETTKVKASPKPKKVATSKKKTTVFEKVNALPTKEPELVQVKDTVITPEPEKELVVNISEGMEVKAEVQVKSLTHPKFFLASLIKILQNSGAKVTFNAGVDLDNSSKDLSGFTMAINEVH